MKKTTIAAVMMLLASAGIASAHVGVKPNQAGIATYTNFAVGVPSEKESATTEVRLVIPEGLESVTPNVKPGWEIEIRRNADRVTELVWKNGRIPAHFREEFLFSAKTPGTAIALPWKAYQTYEDGSRVSWDLAPNAPQPKKSDGSPDFSSVGPYSQTRIVNDLAPKQKPFDLAGPYISLSLSLVALILGLTNVDWSHFAKGKRR